MSVFQTRSRAATLPLTSWYGLVSSCVTFASVVTAYRMMTNSSLGVVVDAAASQYGSILESIFYPVSLLIELDALDRALASIGIVFYMVFVRTAVLLRRLGNEYYTEIRFILIYASAIAIPFPYYGGYVVENGVVRGYHLEEYISILPLVGAIYVTVCLALFVVAPLIGAWNTEMIMDIGYRLRIILAVAANAALALLAIVVATLLSF